MSYPRTGRRLVLGVAPALCSLAFPGAVGGFVLCSSEAGQAPRSEPQVPPNTVYGKRRREGTYHSTKSGSVGPSSGTYGSLQASSTSC